MSSHEKRFNELLQSAVDDKCRMDVVMGSCQHIKFLERKTTDRNGNITIHHYQEIPPGSHYLFGAQVFNPEATSIEAA